MLHRVLQTCVVPTLASATPAIANDQQLPAPLKHPFVYSSNWSGTNLPLRTFEEACRDDATMWPFARWPDPILRRAATAVSSIDSDLYQRGARMLANTAQHHEAVGLAAQQCGIDVRLLYIENPDNKRRRSRPMVMLDPWIVGRSPEDEMVCWTEECLVLPTGFEATVLRDAWVDVEYTFIDLDSPSNRRGDSGDLGPRQRRRFRGEAARCIQHELDHDRGILTVDHIGFDEMESDVMRQIERDGHADRQVRAFDRYLQEATRSELV